MLENITAAIKAQKILLDHNIKTQVEKTPKNISSRSCGYSIIVLQPSQYSQAVNTLLSYGVRVIGATKSY
jgi:hypothetical protein